MTHLTRRQFIAAAGGSTAALMFGSAEFRKQQPPLPRTGITLSHYEFDFELISPAGELLPVAVQNGSTVADALAAFNVLRFMNWQKTNVTWMKPPPATLAEFQTRENRPNWHIPPLDEGITPPSINWGQSEGVPLHACLTIAKQTQTNPWICIPHGASPSDYTAIMQTMVDQTFAALAGTNLIPIFEFSNELWNGAFRQQVETARIVLGREPSNGSEQFLSALDYQVQRTNELAEYVQDRAQVVLSAQCYNPFVAQTLINKGLSQHVDALAIAPYFGIIRDVQYTNKELLPFGFHPLRDLTSGQPFDLTEPYRLIEERIAYNLYSYLQRETAHVFREHRKLLDVHNANKSPLKLWAYEGGPDLHWRDNAWGNDGFDRNLVRELYMEFNRSEQMGHLVATLKQLWHSAETQGDLFNGYSSATIYKNYGIKTGQLNYDSFGFLEIIGTLRPRAYRTTPKYHALLDQFPTQALQTGVVQNG